MTKRTTFIFRDDTSTIFPYLRTSVPTVNVLRLIGEIDGSLSRPNRLDGVVYLTGNGN